MMLAGHLGMPVREVLSRHSSSELTEWMCYFILANSPNKGQSVKDMKSRLKSIGERR